MTESRASSRLLCPALHIRVVPRRCARFLLLACLAGAPLSAKVPPPPVLHPVGDPRPVSSCADCPTGLPEIAGGPDGTFAAVWGGAGTAFQVFLRRLDAAGDGEGDEPVGNASAVALTGLAGDAAGWLLGWYQPAILWTQPLTTEAGASIRVNEGDRGDDHGAAVAVRGDRGLVAWTRLSIGEADGQIVTRRVARDGTPTGAEVVVGTTFGRPVVRACILPSGGAVVVWASTMPSASPTEPGPTGVALRRLDAQGSPVGGVVVVAPPTLTSFYTAPAVACAANGTFVVAWNSDQKPAKSGFDVLWRRFDAKGKPRGPVALLNAAVAGEQREPELLARTDGSVLAAWGSHTDAGDTIAARWIGANGKLAAGEVLMHQLDPGESAHRPRLTWIPGTTTYVLGWWDGTHGRFQLLAH